MKNILFVALITTLFLSCKSNTKTKSESTAINPAEIETGNLIRKFKPIIGGSWVKSDYIDKVIKTQSPLVAADLATGLTVLVIDTQSVKGDSLITSAGWGNHEGGNLVLKFTPGKTKRTIKLGNFDLGYYIRFRNDDTTLVLYDYNPEKNTTTTTRYIKALNKKTKDLGDGMDYLVNKALIAGKYTATDSSGTQRNVSFTDRGGVSGLLNFLTYNIQNDFNGGPMTNLDEIIFDLYSPQQKRYTFKIARDTLKLYDIYANADSTLAVVGKLKYKLVRRK